MSQEKNKDTPKDIPKFKNLEEKIEFWESHSPLDYPGLWEEAEIDFNIESTKHLYAIDPEISKEIQKQAEKRGVSAETYLNIILVKNLKLAS